ncbi:MAG: enoyl-CoA hydratase-related protein [Candidatus Hydrogenedentota bacterium]
MLEVTKENRVMTITINRPEALNAANNAVYGGIRDNLLNAEADSEVAVVVITGKGRAFCAGQDLAEMQARNSGEDSPPSEFPAMLKAVTHFRKPLIAAVNGIGVGIGMTFLAHCDLVLMSSTARLRTPFPQLGLAPEAGSSYSFPQKLGWQNAAYTLLSGRWFDAQECLKMGLVWRVTDPDDLMSETYTVAAELAANPIPSLIATKELLLASGHSEEAMAAHERENTAYAGLLGAPANAEAIKAFQEKRDPDFGNIPGL